MTMIPFDHHVCHCSDTDSGKLSYTVDWLDLLLEIQFFFTLLYYLTWTLYRVTNINNTICHITDITMSSLIKGK